MPKKNIRELEEIEISLFVEGIYQKYGYDFRDYALASFKRRLRKSVEDEGVKTITGLLEKIIHNPDCMARFIDNMSVNVTEMFRDPEFYLSFKKNVLPEIHKQQLARIWHAGCSTGEEVYSSAIFLKEESMFGRYRIYATDMNEASILAAKEGIYSIKSMKKFSSNYMDAGGSEAFSNYYVAKYDNAIIKPILKTGIVWAVHNLVTDSSFNEFNIVFCRNVMIYFNLELQKHVHNLIYDSLAVDGFLMLGSKESIEFSPHKNDYEVVDAKWKIFRKMK